MSKVKIIQEQLKPIILDYLKSTKKLVSRFELEDIAYENGYCRDSAIRIFRKVDGKEEPVIKYNKIKKPIEDKSEKIFYVKWDGGTRVVFNKK